jgi:hypothetical protein
MLHQTLSFILVLACCLVSPAQTTKTKAAKAARSVAVLGDFENIRHFTEDAEGYRLQLWREGKHVFGLLSIYTGAPYDPPTGMLEEVKFDPRTRQFSFSARLSLGSTHNGEKWVATRDGFTFKGVLGRNEISGTLRQYDLFLPQSTPLSKRIKLRRSRVATQEMLPPPESYAAWKQWAEESILSQLGPKW